MGLSCLPKLWDISLFNFFDYFLISVGERSAVGGSVSEKVCGRGRSENVGLSNANNGKNPLPRKPKGSFTRFVHGGLVRS